MKYIPSTLILIVTISFFAFFKTATRQPRILVFTKTAGFRHGAIPKGKAAIQQLGKENGFGVDTTEDASLFTGKNLKRYAAVVFLNTTGDVLNSQQQTDFETYIRKGGGYAGVHAASDTEYDWPWYGKLVGAYFESHPKEQDAQLNLSGQRHISTSHLPAEWKRKDEWYNFKNINPNVTVLLTIDEESYSGGRNGNPHPMSWYHAYDGGRAWYTALGHTDASYSESDFLRHLLGGIQYAMGNADK
ncbi:MAG: ThuA domain-containing protein [Pseudobacter sp.]|uniref:ThuA domain-containing protein n=1 Tax=Pseudobacter sp. TaxID=2045420 RepID=UPI003F7D62AA